MPGALQRVVVDAGRAKRALDSFRELVDSQSASGEVRTDVRAAASRSA